VSGKKAKKYAAIDHVHPTPPPPHVHEKIWQKSVHGIGANDGRPTMTTWGWICLGCGQGAGGNVWHSDYPEQIR